LCHPIEYLNLLWIHKWWHVFQLFVFSLDRVVSLLLKPKNTINAHLSRFRLMSYSLHFWKHNLSFCKWLSMIHCKIIRKYLHKIVQIFS
jgi:hypothetical protein